MSGYDRRMTQEAAEIYAERNKDRESATYGKPIEIRMFRYEDGNGYLHAVERHPNFLQTRLGAEWRFMIFRERTPEDECAAYLGDVAVLGSDGNPRDENEILAEIDERFSETYGAALAPAYAMR